MKKNKFLIIFFGLLVALNSCQSVQEGMSGTKRSKTGDEFLVHKKKPLVVPPDFETMPSPKPYEQKKGKSNQSTSGIEDLLDKNKDNDDTFEKGTDNSLEQSILKKIKTN
tara:strand:- start:1595 stop:1924 length:330 start_codon:yes stop_codon:yes gene_type:complete